MSWYKRTPRVKEPEKILPQTSSPMSIKYLKSTQEKVKSEKETRPKHK